MSQSIVPSPEQALGQIFELLRPFLNERLLRLFVGAASVVIGDNGISTISRITGISRRVITQGREDLLEPAIDNSVHIRKSGGGRKKEIDKDTSLKRDLNNLLHSSNSKSPLFWTTLSVRELSLELNQKGHRTSHRMMAALLHDMGYALQGNQKRVCTPPSSPPEGAQFAYINREIQIYLSAGLPVLAMHVSKKVEQKNADPTEEKVEPDRALSPVNSSIIKRSDLKFQDNLFDFAQDTKWFNLETERITVAMITKNLYQWWNTVSEKINPNVTRLLLTASGIAGEKAHLQLWKQGFQKLADRTNLELRICHFPKGTSKWNKIIQSLGYYEQSFSFRKVILKQAITLNQIVETTVKEGSHIRGQWSKYTKPGDSSLSLPIKNLNQSSPEDKSLGKWNYTIQPSRHK